jgi:3-hydroxybutyryl-CoA dehydrogenase
VVEVVEAEDTSEETVQAAVDFCSRIGKQPLRCLDGPGFAVGRVLGALLSEAWRVEHEGMDAAEVDERVEAAGLLPSGPFRLAERLGRGTLLRAGEHLRDALGPRFYVSPALERLARGDG